MTPFSHIIYAYHGCECYSFLAFNDVLETLNFQSGQIIQNSTVMAFNIKNLVNLCMDKYIHTPLLIFGKVCHTKQLFVAINIVLDTLSGSIGGFDKK